MKLVEILARELAEWPAAGSVATQDKNELAVHFTSGALPAPPKRGEYEWDFSSRLLYFRSQRALTCKADDWDAAIVTRDQWERERTRIELAAEVKKVTGLAEKLRKPTVIELRDRIRAIDAEDVEAAKARTLRAKERAELVVLLAKEGFALIGGGVE
jgi:hypothetical protein